MVEYFYRRISAVLESTPFCNDVPFTSIQSVRTINSIFAVRVRLINQDRWRVKIVLGISAMMTKRYLEWEKKEEYLHINQYGKFLLAILHIEMGYLSVGMFERESIESSLPVISDGGIQLHEGTATRIPNRGVFLLLLLSFELFDIWYSIHSFRIDIFEICSIIRSASRFPVDHAPCTVEW